MKTIYSDILHQNITIDEAKRIVTAEDGIIYKRGELAQLKGLPPKEIIGIHKIKKQFQGEIIGA